MCPLQEPLLFRGTIRENLDPAGTYHDAVLWQALRNCNLTNERSGVPASQLRSPSVEETLGTVLHGEHKERDTPGGFSKTFSLDTKLEESGSNLSAGGSTLLACTDA